MQNHYNTMTPKHFHRFLALAVLALSTVLVGPARAETTAQKAESLYKTAMSQYGKSNYEQALPVLEEFIRRYYGSDRVPYAMLQLAYCQHRLKQPEEMTKTLTALTAKFFGSDEYFVAQGILLEMEREAGDCDAYLRRLQDIARRSQRQLPLNLETSRDWRRRDFGYGAPMSWVGANDDTIDHRISWHWCTDLLWLADSPERAQLVLALIAPTLKEWEHNLPASWEWCHYRLLLKADKTDEAEKQFRTYVDTYGEDPRGLKLQIIRLEHWERQAQRAKSDARDAEEAHKQATKRVEDLQRDLGRANKKLQDTQKDLDKARKSGKAGAIGKAKAELDKHQQAAKKVADALREAKAHLQQTGKDVLLATAEAEKVWAEYVKDSDAIWKRFTDKYMGFDSMNERFYGRFRDLREQKRYAEMAQLGDAYLKSYGLSGEGDKLLQDWINHLRDQTSGEHPEHAARAIKLLDAYADYADPERVRRQLWWKVDLLLKAGQEDQAVKLGKTLMEDHWSGGTFWGLKKRAEDSKAFAALVADARKRYFVPEAPQGQDKTEPQKLLEELRTRLKDDQTRHAEEIGEELFRKHKDDPATIQAVAALSEYYFKKLQPEPRDKWMQRMIDAYPNHPQTGEVLWDKFVALKAARQYTEAGQVLDTLADRFPGMEDRNHHIISQREQMYESAKDWDARKQHVLKHYIPRAERGNIEVLDRKIRWMQGFPSEREDRRGHYKAMGDFWVTWADKLKGTRAELTCLNKAFSVYVNRYKDEWSHYDEAYKVLQRLRNNKLDPELRWAMQFSDINLLARQGKADQALSELDKRLTEPKYYNLSIRVNLPGLGEAIGDAGKIRQAKPLIEKLEKITYTRRDKQALLEMQGRMYAEADQGIQAARYFDEILYSTPWPALMHRYFEMLEDALWSARGGAYAQVANKYLREIATCQDRVPWVLKDLGRWYLNRRDRHVLSIMGRLNGRYKASRARDDLAKEIDRRVR